jgi:pyruvate dehydrogenase E2 component (dihydrolipoamide acetyltransferase)
MQKRVVPDEKAAKDAANPYKVVQILTVALSCDHRVVDGAVGAQWLKVFKEVMEDPQRMLLH